MTALRYTNLAAPVLLTASINDTAQTLSVGSTSLFPSAPFLLSIDRGTPDEELVLCTAKTATTFTVERGYDNTTGVSHEIGAVVEHTTAAITHRQAGIATVTTAERDALSGVDRWTGRTIFNTDTSKLQYWNGTVWVNVGPRAGSIEAFGGSTAPPGTLLCNGQSVSQTTYADLYAVIGTNYGNPGGGNFNVPDLRQRFPLGKAASGTGSTLGESGGAIDHTHTNPTTSSNGSHTHTQGDTGSAGSHTHTNPSTGTTGDHGHGTVNNPLPSGGSAISNDPLSGSQFEYATKNHTHANAGNHSHTVGVTGSSGSHSHTNPTTASGGSHTHTQGDTGSQNPPYLVVNYIIYT